MVPALVLLCVSALAGCRRHAPATSGGPVSTSAESSSAPGIFRDVAAEAGLEYRWTHGGKSPLTIIETIGHGCAFLDYDQDGYLDALLVGNRGCALYRNLGNGRFEDVSKAAGLTSEGEFWGVAVGDYDNDSYPDLYVTGYGKCVLYHNESRGEVRASGVGGRSDRKFVDVTARAGVGALGPYDVVTAAAFADLDGDGRLDLFAGRYIVFTPDSLQYCVYSGVRAGCGVKNYDPAFPRVYRNLGDGKFADRTRDWGFDKSHGKCLGVAVRAMDGGKGVALYAANDELPGDLFIPSGERFVERGTPSGVAYNGEGLTQGGMGVDWGDVNNDGRADLIVATFQSEASSLYLGESGGVYTEVGGPLGIAAGTSPYVGWTARFFDYDDDGWLDLLFTNGHTQDNVNKTESDRAYPQPMILYRNEKGRKFADVSRHAGPAFASPFVGRGAAFGDYDNDGRVDVLIVDEEGAVKLLRNEAKSDNRWLGVKLIGQRSNRDGIGARVTVTANGKTFARDQQLAGGYISAHDPRVHFGLGDAKRIEKVVVRWPNGTVDTVSAVPLDSYVEIKEGSSIGIRVGF